MPTNLGTQTQNEPHSTDRETYLIEGERRALALGNRGPIRFDAAGNLHPDILEAYSRCGFYVFEGVIGAEELKEVERDFLDMLDRLPVDKGTLVDRHGRPALGIDNSMPVLGWTKPLGDPLGGTGMLADRMPVKMSEPKAALTAPEHVVFSLFGALQFSTAALRIYGHPQLLAVAAAVNGDDFTPFSETWIWKAPGLGASVAWHQDGITHWMSPDLDEGTHGFNYQMQLYETTAANSLWVVPGSHKTGKADIRAIAEKAGGERFPGAVPVICKPGDVSMTSRQALHGSFANTSLDWRSSLTFGFHRRRSVLNAPFVSIGDIDDAPQAYTDEVIARRSRVIGYAIAARHQHFPNEKPFSYRPHHLGGLQFEWDAKAQADMKDYNILDLAI
jgi:hypothetical protein